MKRVFGIGSCLANLIGANMAIMFGYQRDYFVAHNRSDNLVRYYVEQRSALPPRGAVLQMIEWKPEFEIHGRGIIENQYPDYLGYQELRQNWAEDGPRLLSDLRDKKYDIIFMDNFCDIFYRLMTFKDSHIDSPIMIPLHMCENFREIAAAMSVGELLGPDESAANWLKIYYWLREMQPQARFVFVCLTYSDLYSDVPRHETTVKFGEAVQRRFISEDVLVLPPLNLAAEYVNPEEDWSHLQPDLYRALSGYVWTKLFSGWDKATKHTLEQAPPATTATDY
jgi:hypothetical protein